jgi:uncharacterized protein (DUF305 family)
MRFLIVRGVAVLAALAALPAPIVAQQQAAAGTTKMITVPGIREPFTEADVYFMAGMIPHHAQAVVMAKMAPSRAEMREVKLLAERIIVSQKDEIEFMRNWLRARGQAVPAPDATHHKMQHGDMLHDMLMPGMLSEDELKKMENAKGKEFDRLFLTYMIRHHEGALKMTEDLFKTTGAAQSDDVYLFASDVQADQEIEIDRMQQLLASIK